MPARNSTSAAQELIELRRFAGTAREFWPRFAAAIADVCNADRCVIAVRSAPSTPPSPPASPAWRKLQEWSSGDISSQAGANFQAALVPLADRAVAEGAAAMPLGGAGTFAVGVRLVLPASTEMAVGLLLVSNLTESGARDALERLELASDVPWSFQQAQAKSMAESGSEKIAGVLDILAQVQAEARFRASATALCNAVSGRFKADRVALGWLHGPAVHLVALSRTERFNRQMAAAQSLEAAMEEAIDQDGDLVWPAPEQSPWIQRDLERHCREQASGNAACVPLRVGNAVVACLVCERRTEPYGDDERKQLRLITDLAAPRLAELQRHDRWFGARWMARGREFGAGLVGPHHTWAKLLGIGIAAAVLLLVVVQCPYRVEATFALHADSLVHVSTPFDGYLVEVFVRPGDVVTNQQVLLQLDTRDLALDESVALAEVQRFQREAEKSRATHNLADMRIAEALARQSQARLDLVRHRLNQAAIRAPFDGVVIEGDFRDKLGSPARMGDPLFRVARLDRLYVVAEVPERDIHELQGTERGEIAFFSQPRLKFPVRGAALEPAATVREGGAVFQFRCTLEQPAEPWFRPGMGGIAKIDSGRRRLLWVLTHRTVDFLRLYLWW